VLFLKILVINSGSSSLKFTLFEMENETRLAHGMAERIGQSGSSFHFTANGGGSHTIEVENLNYRTSLALVIKYLLDPKFGVIKDIAEISAVGHRIVHGGEHVSAPIVLDSKTKSIIKECFELAPLHNPPNLQGIVAAEDIMPGVPQIGVFDTAFFQSIPQHAFLYAIPYEMYKRDAVRRYGFHGTSHKYVSIKASGFLDEPKEFQKIITCHLGNGCSISAIKGGKPLDTSMGLTPLEGLVMGTRCGDIDPAIVVYLMNEEHLSSEEIYEILNKKSGLLGISGLTSDFRDILNEADKGNKRALLALRIFSYRLKKYIGSYYTVLGGLDALVFTAGIGEHSAHLRADVCNKLECIGISIDSEANRNSECVISDSKSKVKVLVIPTNEELMIARDTLAVVQAQ